MNKLKFRGLPVEDTKCPNTGEIVFKKEEFVYGNLIVDGSKSWIVGGVADIGQEYISLEYWCRVKPETVGCYTGINDSNGMGVYTGDMVRADLYEPGYPYVARPYICEVVFEGQCYVLKVINHADKSHFKPGRVPKIPKSMQYSYISMAENLTVISNRWDNLTTKWQKE